MENIGLSVVHRLPQSYRWLSGKVGSSLEAIPMNTADSNKLVGLKLLSHDCETDTVALKQLADILSDMQIDSVTLDWQGELCLFIRATDEQAAMCRFKAFGMAVAESVTAFYPF